MTPVLRAIGPYLLLVFAAACSGGSPRAPTTPAPLPGQLAQTEAALAEFGARLYDALAQGRPEEVTFRPGALSALLSPEAEHDWLATHANPRPGRVPDDDRAMWAAARFAEICVQQGRAEPKGGVLGLRKAGFVFERALLVGRERGGGALAGWVEGQFLFTDAGFGALRLDRVEGPRRDHSDLEIAVCELRARAENRNP